MIYYYLFLVTQFQLCMFLALAKHWQTKARIMHGNTNNFLNILSGKKIYFLRKIFIKQTMLSVYVLASIYIATSRACLGDSNNTVEHNIYHKKEIIQWLQHDYNFRQKGYTGLSSLWQNELMHSGKITLLSFNFPSEKNKISLKENL